MDKDAFTILFLYLKHLGQSSCLDSQMETDLDKGFCKDLEESRTGDGENLESSTSEGGEVKAESPLLISSSVGAWDILIGLLSSLKRVSELYLEQGMLKEAYYYAREGAMLARGLLLSGW